MPKIFKIENEAPGIAIKMTFFAMIFERGIYLEYLAYNSIVAKRNAGIFDYRISIIIIFYPLIPRKFYVGLRRMREFCKGDRFAVSIFDNVLVFPHLYQSFFYNEGISTSYTLLKFFPRFDSLAQLPQWFYFFKVFFGYGNLGLEDDILIVVRHKIIYAIFAIF